MGKNSVVVDFSYGAQETQIAPVLQSTVFIIMWQSRKSGGTYTELRKSELGRDRFLRSLEFMGVDMSSVRVIQQEKPWVPVRKTKKVRL